MAAVSTALIGAVVAVTWLRGRGTGKSPVLPVLQRWLDGYRPEVVLYFAGPAKDVYQANMWLAPTEALDQRAVVLMRSKEAFFELADTRLPVICVPAGPDFMNLDLGTVRAAALRGERRRQHPHAARARHEARLHRPRRQRQAGQRQPVRKVYDEVWVAGLAGRRALRTGRGGRPPYDRTIVEIGRPQARRGRTASARRARRPFTVLYAPTWEGWLDDALPHLAGSDGGADRPPGCWPPRAAAALPPHPLTGSRSKEAKAVHDRLVSLIRAAGGDPDAGSLDGPGHRVVTGRVPALFDCFNQTDLLVSDISSVVSDFVQSQRPYVVANPGGCRRTSSGASSPPPGGRTCSRGTAASWRRSSR